MTLRTTPWARRGFTREAWEAAVARCAGRKVHMLADSPSGPYLVMNAWARAMATHVVIDRSAPVALERFIAECEAENPDAFTGDELLAIQEASRG